MLVHLVLKCYTHEPSSILCKTSFFLWTFVFILCPSLHHEENRRKNVTSFMSKRVSWNRFKGRLPDNTARVDRSTVWGNPYKLADYSREESLKLFSHYLDGKLQQEPDFLAPLKGKDIACSCSLSVACHGDIIITKLITIYG